MMKRKIKRLGFKQGKGFSLVEVIVACAVLAFGIVIVCQGFIVALGGFNYALDHLNVLLWMDSKIWEVQDKLIHYRTLLTDDLSGSFMVEARKFDWELAYNLIEGTQDLSLYEVSLHVKWNEGLRAVSASRSAYALYNHPEE